MHATPNYPMLSRHHRPPCIACGDFTDFDVVECSTIEDLERRLEAAVKTATGAEAVAAAKSEMLNQIQKVRRPPGMGAREGPSGTPIWSPKGSRRHSAAHRAPVAPAVHTPRFEELLPQRLRTLSAHFRHHFLSRFRFGCIGKSTAMYVLKCGVAVGLFRT